MVRHRIISIRSYGLGIIAALAAILFVSFPAHAVSIAVMEPGYHVSSIADLHMPLIVEHTDAAIAVVPRSYDTMIVDAAKPPELLKPEYAESYETHGLNFIDLRRRC